ncbi:MAG: T9SS type A sorting domain-containing protein [Saprospiraceae bacterium]|nr:T9SS type A sorting domain-containing protein [Saprospiraceae bacterium]
MKIALQIIIIAFHLLNLNGQVRYDLQMMVEGRLRETIVVIPSKAPPTGGYPIVVMLHGTSQDGPQFYDISGWKELGEEENFITVFPTSLRWCYLDDGIEEISRRWVNGNVTDNPCSGTPQNYVSDVHFLKLLVQKIADTFQVNKAMIFASGFSNGSAMVQKLAMDAGDVFAACAGSGGFLPMGDSTKPLNRIPVWLMLGTNDDRHIRPPYTEIPFGGDSLLAYFKGPLNRLLVCQGLTENYTKFETSITHSYEFSESQPGEEGMLFRFTLIQDMFHIYPTEFNSRINAPRLFWEFFKNSVAVANSSLNNTKAEVRIYPNPSNDIVTVDLKNFTEAKPIYILVFNSVGICTASKKLINQTHVNISKNEIGTGLFILQISQGSKFGTQTFCFN